MVNCLGKCGGCPPLGHLVDDGGLEDGSPAGTEVHCDEELNDHLLLFVSRSTKQHLFPEACLQSALMDSF